MVPVGATKTDVTKSKANYVKSGFVPRRSADSSVHAGPPSVKFPASRVGCLRLQKESSQSCCLTFALRRLDDTVTVCLSICAPFTTFSLSGTAFTRHISISRIRIQPSPVLVVGSVNKMRGGLFKVFICLLSDI